MKRFKTTLKTEQLDRRHRKLLAPLVYDDAANGEIVVPEGFITDFASIKVLHNVFLFVLFALVATYGNYAATLHDWLYREAQLSRKECDAVLYRALRDEGVARWRSALFWIGVRIGGAKHYGTK